MKAVSLYAVIDSIRSKVDHSLGLTVSTPEMSTDEKALFFDLQGLNVNLTITPMEEPVDETVEIKSEAEPKTRSQKLRSVLYVLWQQDFKDKYPTFTDFYNQKMDQWIEDIKVKLN